MAQSITSHQADVVRDTANEEHQKNESRARAHSVSDQGEQAGVQKARILRSQLSKRGLIVTYIGLYLTMFANRFSIYNANVYSAYATSAFSEHSLLSAAGVVSDITQLCAYPVIAKLGDVIGRAEGFAFSIANLVLASILYAAAPNIETYLVAGIFNAIGDTGLLLTEQVFIAETTNLLNRGFWAALPEATTGIIAIYAGSLAANQILETSTWRWGYGMWAIIVPVCAAPLIVTLFILQHRVTKTNKIRTLDEEVQGEPLVRRIYQFLWVELDLLGSLLLVAGFSLLFIPLSLTGSSNVDGWSKPSFIAMLVVGVVLIILFGVWDGRFAQKPVVPYRLVKNMVVVAACLLGAIDFLSYSIFTIFFPSYLQVVPGYNAGLASRISNSLIASYQVTRILTGILLRFTKHSQPWVLIGVPLVILGQGLMIRFTDMPGNQPANQASFVVSKVLVGVGRGMYHTASLVTVQAVVAEQQLSVATAVFLALMTVGSAIGESAGGAIWRNTLLRNLRNYLPADAQDQATAIYGSLVKAKSFAAGSATRDAINHAYSDSMQLLAIVATALLAPMLVLMFFVKDIRLTKSQSVVEKDEDAEVLYHGSHEEHRT